MENLATLLLQSIGAQLYRRLGQRTESSIIKSESVWNPFCISLLENFRFDVKRVDFATEG
jgi:hypothetical protein